MSLHEQFIYELLEKIKQNNLISVDDFAMFKRKFAKNHKVPCLVSRNLIVAYKKLLAQKKIAENKYVENILRVRKVRTISGVAVVAVLTKPYKCPGKCRYCPTEKNMPKSYLSNEPAVMRAMGCDFDPYRQVQARLRALQINGHNTDKIELIVMGGTFSYLPKQYQTWFIKQCFAACNTFTTITNNQTRIKNEYAGKKTKQKTLQELKKTNETAKHRIVGLTLETRPDYIDLAEIHRMRKLGATRVELGVQSIYNKVLEKNHRGHLVQQTIKATQLLKDAGFKINYHMMLGLPGSSYTKDLKMMRKLFADQNFQPDMLKIYPCVVLKNTKIYTDYKKGIYKPYSDKQLLKLLCEIKKDIPYYVRIVRVIRDIPAENIVGGSKISNLRQYVQENQKKNNWRCRCIRCREVKEDPLEKETLKMFRIDYSASNGKEIFLSFENSERTKLYSLLRLRIPEFALSKPKTDLSKNFSFLKPLKNAALIREVHTYGQMLPLKDKNTSKKASQHKGLGRKLLQEAEKIAKKEFGLNKMAVISGVGVRGYYTKLGYKLEDEYMIKRSQ